MRQMIYEVLGAESGATLTEYGMFADACAIRPRLQPLCSVAGLRER